MEPSDIIVKTAAFVRSKLEGEGSGHDWWHIDRVRNLALRIATDERADVYVVELGALLHDIADWKFHDGDTEAGPKASKEWLVSVGANEQTIEHVCDIVRHISYKGSGVADKMSTLEGRVVQDADRLDALGAIGIGRAFAYGGHKEREMYNPEIPPVQHASFEQYKNSKGTTVNHFYEKLLLLKERMNTETGKRLAAERHQYMEGFLEQFLKEWKGEA